jgi:succinyl-CoA:(S)-malate CoA-transferase subunit B
MDLCEYPDRAPANPGSATIADYMSGLFAAYGVLVADRYRNKTGRGQVIDVALYESIFRILDSLSITYSVTGKGRERMGTATALAAPHNHYPTRDGKWVAIACTNDRIFARLAALMGQDGLVADPRFSDERERVANRAEVDRIVETWTRGQDMAPLMEALVRSEIPSSPIHSVADIFEDRNSRREERWRPSRIQFWVKSRCPPSCRAYRKRRARLNGWGAVSGRTRTRCSRARWAIRGRI